MPAPFMSILNAFAEARSRDQARYRCTECGAVRREHATANPPESLACRASYRDDVCDGRAVLEPSDAA